MSRFIAGFLVDTPRVLGYHSALYCLLILDTTRLRAAI